MIMFINWILMISDHDKPALQTFNGWYGSGKIPILFGIPSKETVLSFRCDLL